MRPLPAIDRHAFLDQGFLRIDDVLDDAERKWLAGIYTCCFDPSTPGVERKSLGGAAGGRELLPQVLTPSKRFPELRSSPFGERLLAIGRALLGESATFRNDHMILKPAGYGAATPWHQDQSYHRTGFRYTNVNIWIPLDGATEEEGCLRFVPGTHRGVVAPHRVAELGQSSEALEALGQEYWQANAVTVPCPRGSATCHHSYLMHGAGPNRAGRDRRAYIAVFALEPQPLAHPQVFTWSGHG